MGATERAVEPRPRRHAYRCFLVRCRLEENSGPGGDAAWRFTVEQAGDGEVRRSFASLDAVAAYIDQELAACSRVAGR